MEKKLTALAEPHGLKPGDLVAIFPLAEASGY
mgnify:CR=1 FL=1